MKNLLRGMMVAAIAGMCCGCQTFTLTKEEFARQQRGGTADHEVGEVMEVLGTLGTIGISAGTVAGAIR
jgi:hypothetical protein